MFLFCSHEVNPLSRTGKALATGFEGHGFYFEGAVMGCILTGR
jgi:hypothetical protein